jgi:hypothetical protein
MDIPEKLHSTAVYRNVIIDTCQQLYVTGECINVYSELWILASS